MHRRNIDDSSAIALFHHLSCRRLRAQPGPGEIHGDNFLPQIKGKLNKWSFEFDPGIVHEDIKLSKFAYGLLDQILDLDDVGYVRFHGCSPASGSDDLLQRFIGKFAVADIVYDHSSPFAGKSHGNGLPNAG